MTSEEAYWAGLGPEDFRDEEPMTQPLTKKARAEMRREVQEIIDYYMAGDHFNPDLRKSKDILKRYIAEIEWERDLATAKLATAEICECIYDDSWKTSQDVVTGACVYNKKCPNCTNGVQFSDERAMALLERLEAADLATAKLATARVCAKCDGKGELSGYKAGNCPHCTNGVVFSDERARKLLAINIAAIALSDWLEETGKEPDIAEFNRRSVALHEAIRAAQVKEGKE